MNRSLILSLERDCDAVQVPTGDKRSLPGGTEVEITQSSGSSFTVRSEGGLFSIQGKDADALGLDWTGGDPETGGVAVTTQAVEKQV